MAEGKNQMTQQIRQEIKELTTSIGNLMSVFRQIRKPIQESFETVPTTAQHLEKVTEQTEKATQKVLDMVEAINSRESQISDWIKRVKELIPDKVLSATDNLNQLLEDIAKNAEANLNDSFNIMDAMQFQDITSQQMDHAITSLDDVEEKLMSLLSAVRIKVEKSPSKCNKKKRFFDANAKFTPDNSKKQQEIDEIISNMD